MSIRDMVDHLLDPSSHIQRSARQAQLHILSQSYPDDVLDGVMSSLDFASGDKILLNVDCKVPTDLF